MEFFKNALKCLFKTQANMFSVEETKKNGVFGFNGRASKSEYIVNLIFFIFMSVLLLGCRGILTKVGIAPEIVNICANVGRYLWIYFFVVFVLVFHRRMQDVNISILEWIFPFLIVKLSGAFIDLLAYQVNNYIVPSRNGVMLWVVVLLLIPAVLAIFIFGIKFFFIFMESFKPSFPEENEYGEVPEDFMKKIAK